MVASQPGDHTMSIAITTDHFEIDDIALVFHAFRHTVCWLRGDNKLIVDRPDGSAWCWTREFGRWTVRDDGSIVDGWI
jgi:hypothetical protein